MTLRGTVTAQDLAADLGVSRWTVRRWQAEGLIPGPDLRSPGGRAVYSEPLAAAIRRLILSPKPAAYRLREAIADALDDSALSPADQDTLARQLAERLSDDERVAIL